MRVSETQNGKHLVKVERYEATFYDQAVPHQKTIIIFCSLIFLLVKIHQFSLFYCEPSGEIFETRIICGPLVFIYIKKYKPGFGEVLLFFTITRLCLFKHVRNMIAKNLRIGRNMSYGK